MEKYYVSVDGNDTNPGTQKNPFRTLKRINQVAGKNDELVVVVRLK